MRTKRVHTNKRKEKENETWSDQKTLLSTLCFFLLSHRWLTCMGKRGGHPCPSQHPSFARPSPHTCPLPPPPLPHRFIRLRLVFTFIFPFSPHPTFPCSPSCPLASLLAYLLPLPMWCVPNFRLSPPPAPPPSIPVGYAHTQRKYIHGTVTTPSICCPLLVCLCPLCVCLRVFLFFSVWLVLAPAQLLQHHLFCRGLNEGGVWCVACVVR